MTSRFSADIQMDAGPHNMAIYQAISVDNSYYSGPDSVDITYDNIIHVHIEADRLAHLRAGINSVLRLAKTAADSLESLD